MKENRDDFKLVEVLSKEKLEKITRGQKSL